MTSDEIALAALWVAGTSGLIALASLCWQIYNALRVDRPVLKVRATHMFTVPGGLRAVCVTVTNFGRRPTQVTNIMLCIGKRPQRFLPRRWRRDVAMMPQMIVALSTKLPATIGVGESLSVYYDAALVARAAKDDNVTTVFGMANGATTGVRYSRYINAPK